MSINSSQDSPFRRSWQAGELSGDVERLVLEAVEIGADPFRTILEHIELAKKDILTEKYNAFAAMPPEHIRQIYTGDNCPEGVNFAAQLDPYPSPAEILEFCRDTHFHPAHLASGLSAIHPNLLMVLAAVAGDCSLPRRDRELAFDRLHDEQCRFEDIADEDIKEFFESVDRHWREELGKAKIGERLFFRRIGSDIIPDIGADMPALIEAQDRLDAYEEFLSTALDRAAINLGMHCDRNRELERILAGYGELLFAYKAGEAKEECLRFLDYYASQPDVFEMMVSSLKGNFSRINGEPPWGHLNRFLEPDAVHATVTVDEGMKMGFDFILQGYCRSIFDLKKIGETILGLRQERTDHKMQIAHIRELQELPGFATYYFPYYRNKCILDDFDFGEIKKSINPALTREHGDSLPPPPKAAPE